MTDMIFEVNGTSHRITTPADLQKALGHEPINRIVMTNEAGEIIGMGNSLAAVQESKPLFKTLSALGKDGVMLKGKSAHKRVSFAKGGFGGILNELENLKKSRTLAKGLSVSISENDGELSVDELVSIAVDLQERVAVLESAVSKLLILAIDKNLPAEA